MSATPQPAQLPFTKLGEWDVLAHIADGGMANVYLGRDGADPTRYAALKVIRPELARNKAFVAMFLDEARLAMRLSHPSIAAVYGTGDDGARHFLAMELLFGRTLLEVWDALRARGKKLPFEIVAWIGARVADALHYAHELKAEDGKPLLVVHRDVNPANVFVTAEGEPKLIDFGLAKARDRVASTAAGVVKGKLAYLSPEQTHGKTADRRADIFALGVTLWELTADRRLFKADDDVETVRRVQSAEVPDPTTVAEGYPRALAEIVLHALARDPSARYATAAELAADLDAFVRGSGRSVSATSVAPIVRELFPKESAPAWERLVVKHPDARARVRVWDDQAQKMTWMAASVETMMPATRSSAPPSQPPPPPGRSHELDRTLAARIAAIDAADTVAMARAHLERSLVDELLGAGNRAAAHAEASLRAAPTPSAHAALRRLRHGRNAARALIEHLDAEIAACASDDVRADLLAERARLVEAAGDESAAAWERALAVRADHPAALKGLEGALAGAAEPLAAHLARVAEAYVAEPKLCAWVQVERARLLDRALGKPEEAKGALARALQVDFGHGPVRDACTLHAVVHGDAEWLVALLSGEAELEEDKARAARLELDAATVAHRRLKDAPRAIALLERAAARAPTSALVDRRVHDDLVELYEGASRPADALRARRARLSWIAEPRARAHELRAIAAIEEAGDRDAAIADLEAARALSGEDETIVDELDRLLAVASRDARRVELWAQEASRAPAGAKRARLLVRAARIAESIGEVPAAIEHLRAALVASPGDAEAVESLVRLSAAPPTEAALADARARTAVYAHAAEHATDPARRLAWLEAMALWQEEALGDAALAAQTYEAVLRLEPGRRSAVIGLGRTAARAHDAGKLARALLDEAAASSDAASADALRVRAAEALAPVDESRALALLEEVLARRPEDATARALERRIHGAAGRWSMVDRSIGAALEQTKDAREKVHLHLARAEIQSARLHAAEDALASVREALRADGDHPAAQAVLASLLSTLGDPRAARDAFVGLASSSRAPQDRARHLVRAAEIDELLLEDDAHAAELYGKAVELVPDEPWIAERRARVTARRARTDKSALRELAMSPVDRALVLVETGGDLARASALAEEAAAAAPTAPHALRTLEKVARVRGAAPLLANAFAEEADAFAADAPKLGALWAMLQLVEWKLPPGGDVGAIALRILERAPADRAAVDVVVRALLPKVRARDAAAQDAVAAALRVRLAQASDDTARLVDRLALALVLDPPEGAKVADEPRAREALEHYRAALAVDGRSALAAAGCARLGAALGDAEAVVAASVAHAEIAPNDKERARALVHAAGQILVGNDQRLGARPERLSRAGDWLERALACDAEAMAGIGMLTAIRTEQGARDRLLATLRDVLGRAKSTDAVVLIGTELARAACTDPPDRVLAIDALRRVLAQAPSHVATLRTLADLYLAQGALGEAAEALESLAKHAREPQTKLPALFELAELYGKTLQRPADAERALRGALDADPANARALRDLATLRRAAGAPTEEIAALLARLGEAERAPAAKSAVLVELSELRAAAGDRASAEKALIEAAAQTPSPALLAKLLALSGDPASQARALEQLASRGQQIDRVEAAHLAALGQIEVDSLQRYREGVGHLRVAVALAPGMHEARAALARGLVRLAQGGEALAVLTPMVTDGAALVALRDPAAAMKSLEAALALEARHEEAIVARELCAIAGGLDDGAHVELRARRLEVDSMSPPPILFDRTALRANLAPPEAQSVLLDVGAALAGIETKIVRTDLAELGIGPRDAIAPQSGHPAVILVYRLARMLGVAPPVVTVTDQVTRTRVAVVDPAPWLLVPQALFSQPEPVQTASIARGLVRLALGMPWTEELSPEYVHAVLCGAARQVVGDFAADLPGSDQQELIEEYGRRIRRAIGRRQKKALGDLAAQLAITPPPTVADVGALLIAIARTELRAAFVVTGDLLAVLDDLRATDPAFARDAGAVGPRALAATLAHPLSGDLARFALSGASTAVRWRAGTLWRARR